jgi:hypothetical protein
MSDTVQGTVPACTIEIEHGRDAIRVAVRCAGDSDAITRARALSTYVELVDLLRSQGKHVGPHPKEA